MPEVLIASSEADAPTYGPVVSKLESRGLDVFVYNSDRVYSRKDLLSVTSTPSGEYDFVYNGQQINLNEVRSAWYRQPGLISSEPYDDKARMMCITEEVRCLQDFFWQLVPAESWLNSPSRMREAQVKLGQLAMASSLGFNVPQTVVANNWEPIYESLPDDTVVKMPRGVLNRGNETRVFYTTRLSHTDVEKMESLSPFPAIYQAYVNKAREWRITVVGENVFDVAIYTAGSAKDDWRLHQFTDKVEFKAEAVDDHIKQKCMEFLRKYGLGYGAFDFVEDNDGKLTFLECNPNGQYMWLERLLDLPISDAIARELASRVEN